jgi:hypothetical protein
MTQLRGSAGINGEEQSKAQRGDGEKEGTHSGAIGFGPELRGC